MIHTKKYQEKLFIIITFCFDAKRNNGLLVCADLETVIFYRTFNNTQHFHA